MVGIWSWMFGRRKNAKLLNSLQEKAWQKPQNCQAQVRLGNLLTKMGKKKAALEAYHHAAENFAQQGFTAEATAMSKIIRRLDPLQREIQEKVSEFHTQREAFKEKKGTLGNEPETNHGVG
jgi:hypothetical protein